MSEHLKDLRQNIDALDAEWVSTLGERFKFTQQVGDFKASQGIAAVDIEREKEQFRRINELALTSGVPSELAKLILRQIINEVVFQHQQSSLNIGSADD